MLIRETSFAGDLGDTLDDLNAKRIIELEDRLKQYQDDAKAVLEERCGADERHCACVPHLRQALAEARKDPK